MAEDNLQSLKESLQKKEDGKNIKEILIRKNFEEEEEEEEGREKEEEEEDRAREIRKKKKPVEIIYDSAKHISGPICAAGCSVPINILEFCYSFAYDCRKYFNLCVADPTTIVFASGNLIHIYNVTQNKMSFRRSSTGGGIGHIAKNPTSSHLAIAENGIDPPISIYDWPTMEIVTLLFGGAQSMYSHLAYSPDGMLLVSQGGQPDLLITVWNWKDSQIMLKCKSYGHYVYNIMFSPTLSGNLVTSGIGHLKFWKMAQTFTGLKLKGEIGRFGKTELSDIIGFYSMPDGKVISGCEWGNMLLWDEGLIKLEICKRNRQTCHSKAITQFEYLNGEIISVGMDGWIRVWFYETIDQADPPEDDLFLELQPIYEFQISENTQSSMLMSIQKQEPNDIEETLWYAQDGNGGLWIVDLATLQTPEAPKKIFKCHAGAIIDMDCADWGPYVATLDKNGQLHVYDYYKNILILTHTFSDIGRCIIWLPYKVDETGCTLICAFASGVIRMMTIATATSRVTTISQDNYIQLIEALKPHSKPITVISLNGACSLLVTGSEDSTIFVFKVKQTTRHPNLIPIGYVNIPSSATYLTWNPSHETMLLIGCMKSDCVQIVLPDKPPFRDPLITYELYECSYLTFKFESVKSSIRRDIFQAEVGRKKVEKRERKKEKIEKMRADNPAIEIDEETFLADSEEDIPLPKIYIPEIPNSVLLAHYTSQGTIWVLMAGFDAGFIYEYSIPQEDTISTFSPIRITAIVDAEDSEIRSWLFYKQEKYLILGMECGEIRVCRIKEDDYTNLSDYWILPMHDNYNGHISKILLTHDHKMLLTCGHDGNLFSFIIHDDTPNETVNIPRVKERSRVFLQNVEDIDEPDYPTIEQVVVNAEYNRLLLAAKKKKDQTLRILQDLTIEFSKILDRNRGLLKSQRIPSEEFELDARITMELKEQLKKKMNLVHKKFAFKLEESKLRLQKLMDHFIHPITCLPFAICKILQPDSKVYSLREQKLDANFLKMYTKVLQCLEEKEGTGREGIDKIDKKEDEIELRAKYTLESFLKQIGPSTAEYELGVQITQMLHKYRTKKAQLDKRENEWKAMRARRPDQGTNNPNDVMTLEETKNTIGDYKLKTSTTFTAQSKVFNARLIKYKQILACRWKLHALREDFNTNLKAIRSEKEILHAEVVELTTVLKSIHIEIPQNKIRPLPNAPVIQQDVEFPDGQLQLEKYTSMQDQIKEAKHLKHSIVRNEQFDPADEEFEVLLLDEKIVYGQLSKLPFSLSQKTTMMQCTIDSDMSEILCFNDQTETMWERELKCSRLTRKMYEQECILTYIQDRYERMDEKLNKIEKRRLDIVMESVYMEIFILTLHQEFIILKKYEAMENRLRDKVNKSVSKQMALKQKIDDVNMRIEDKLKEISKCQETIKNLFVEYMAMISDNKFVNFLRKIFKKKFKPPKAEDASGSSSESESESSSENDDTASADSNEVVVFHFNENVCPLGCDKHLYDLAFDMRDKRYKYEQIIKDETKMIDTLHKEVDNDLKKLKVVEHTLKCNQDELTAYMLEKQQKLNDIDMTVVLKLHQLQQFIDPYELAKLDDCIVFDKTNLSHLYTRIEELQNDTLQLQSKHKKDKIHLHRMKVDCKYMGIEIARVKAQIKEEMLHKFGQEVSLIVLYETVLRQMIAHIKANTKNLLKYFDEQIKATKKECGKELLTLQNLIQDNTEKLSFLTILEEEELKLQRILKQHPLSEEKMMQAELQLTLDIKKLEHILERQAQQKQLLQNDIKNLSMKSRPLPPLNFTKSASNIVQDKKCVYANQDSCIHESDGHKNEDL